MMTRARASGIAPLGSVLLALCLALALGCASQSRPGHRSPTPTVTPPPTTPPRDCPACAETSSPKVLAAYAAAVADAKYPDAHKVSRELLALTGSNTQLVRNKQGQILMATWTNAKYYQDPEEYSPGKRFALYGDTWFTAVPRVQDFCRPLGMDGAMLVLRLEQLFGLPPDNGKDAFLQVWVRPEDLFRPCPDPEISDHECEVQIPMIGAEQTEKQRQKEGKPPWDCDPQAKQVSSKFVTVAPSHLQWMCDNWASTYGNEDLLNDYPWTALGYTYDWGNPDDPRGESEFVALGGSEVVFESITLTEEYCGGSPTG